VCQSANTSNRISGFVRFFLTTGESLPWALINPQKKKEENVTKKTPIKITL
jgi:hypothetical protein